MANPNIVSVTAITAGTMGWNLPTGGLVNLISPSADYLLKINRIVVANHRLFQTLQLLEQTQQLI